MENSRKCYIGLDVGTNSVRAVIVDEHGKLLKLAVHPLTINNPLPECYEQSSDQVWDACCKAVKSVLEDQEIRKDEIRGVGFDATCSLVILDDAGQPLGINPAGIASSSSVDANKYTWNVIMWMDHRAKRQADKINASKCESLRSVGGCMSLEMQPPKLLWLKQTIPKIVDAAGHFMDLTDFLTFKATGSLYRSLCCVVCKWLCGIGDKPEQWNRSFYESIGLADLAENNFSKLGSEIATPGTALPGGLTVSAAEDLGLCTGTPVAVGLIDAYAGCLGVLFSKIDDEVINQLQITDKMLLICGTSTCHMSFTKEPVYVPGVWGPYPKVIFEDFCLLEAGQSSVGPMLDNVAEKSCLLLEGKENIEKLENSPKGVEYQTLLCHLLDQRVEKHGIVDTIKLARNINVWPDYYGNRSPLADPTMTGAILGLKQEDSVNKTEYALAMYLAHVQAVALMTRFIMDVIEGKTGRKFKVLYMCGGLQRNSYFVQSHADACQLPVVLTQSTADEQPVARGAAILGAAASADFANLKLAARALSAAGNVVKPNIQLETYYDHKYKIFRKIGDLMIDITKLNDSFSISNEESLD